MSNFTSNIKKRFQIEHIKNGPIIKSLLIQLSQKKSKTLYQRTGKINLFNYINSKKSKQFRLSKSGNPINCYHYMQPEEQMNNLQINNQMHNEENDDLNIEDENN